MGKETSQNNQERRLGKERRIYEYALHIPERRRKSRRKEDKRKNPKEALDNSSTLKKGSQKKAKNKKADSSVKLQE